MATKTILFADNAPEFLKTRSEFLEFEGYRVIPVSSPDEAMKALQHESIDLVILDIRLLNDNDEKDFSGITLAKEMPRSIPKIILTNHPTVSVVREALRPQSDGLPATVEFLAKEEGPAVLIHAIEQIFECNDN